MGKAVIVVDMQRDEDNMFKGVLSIVPKVRRLLEEARRKGHSYYLCLRYKAPGSLPIQENRHFTSRPKRY